MAEGEFHDDGGGLISAVEISAAGDGQPLAEFMLAPLNYHDRQADILTKRYQLKPQSPLPDLDSAFAKAFEAVDLEGEHLSLYGLVMSNTMPVNPSAIRELLAMAAPALCTLRAAGPVMLSHPSETRLVLFIDKPRGKNFRELIAQSGQGLNETFVIDKILRPLQQLLSDLHARKIVHGCINPATLYFEEKLMVRECLSEPSGYSQNFMYEAPDRLVTHPVAKSGLDLSADIYAFGILALFLTHGRLPLQNLPREDVVKRLISQGAYTAYLGDLDVSDAIGDLLRGTLQDDTSNRWTIGQVGAWVNGKRFNTIAPTPPRDSSRAFSFSGADFFGRHALAYAFQQNWDEVMHRLPAGKFIRWLELGIGEDDLAGLVARMLHVSEDESRVKDLTDEEVGKIIALLDPNGPLRARGLAVNLDGMGAALAYHYRQKEGSLLQTLLALVTGNLTTYITTLPGRRENANVLIYAWKMPRLKTNLRISGLGFGVERVLYDLNPTIPCQTGWLLPYHIMTLRELLIVLDDIAKEKMNSISLVDRHLAAFLASRLDMSRELRVKNVSHFPTFAKDPQMVMAWLLDAAQRETKSGELKNLTQWVASGLIPCTSLFNSRKVREQLIPDLRKSGSSGKLRTVVKVLADPALIENDLKDYHRARQLHDYHKRMVRMYQDSGKVQAKAKFYGRQISVTIGYSVFVFTCLWVIFPILNV